MLVKDFKAIYEKASAADKYVIGFTYKHNLYFTMVDDISLDWLCVEKASRNQGENLRLRIRKAAKEALMATNPVCLGSEDRLTAEKYNKGENFEKIITEYFGQVWEKDTIPFWVQGDICLDGVEVQIKLDSATLMNTKQIERLPKVA